MLSNPAGHVHESKILNAEHRGVSRGTIEERQTIARRWTPQSWEEQQLSERGHVM